jgi:integrase/recombinase XerC/integrase/recombinase XerD
VALRRFYTWLQAQGLYPNVCEVKGAKKPRGFSKDTFTPGQLRDILSGIDTASLDGLRDFALVNLLARTALRTIELARANVGDLRQESGQAVLYIQGKGRASKDDFVILTDEAERPLRKYLHARAKIEGRPLQDSFPLFSSLSDRNRGQGLTPRSISRTCKAAFRQAGLDSSRLTAHSLRHTGITLALKGGASIQQAQAMARHADISTTMIYAHNLDRVSQAAERCIQF